MTMRARGREWLVIGLALVGTLLYRSTAWGQQCDVESNRDVNEVSDTGTGSRWMVLVNGEHVASAQNESRAWRVLRQQLAGQPSWYQGLVRYKGRLEWEDASCAALPIDSAVNVPRIYNWHPARRDTLGEPIDIWTWKKYHKMDDSGTLDMWSAGDDDLRFREHPTARIVFIDGRAFWGARTDWTDREWTEIYELEGTTYHVAEVDELVEVMEMGHRTHICRVPGGDRLRASWTDTIPCSRPDGTCTGRVAMAEPNALAVCPDSMLSAP